MAKRYKRPDPDLQGDLFSSPENPRKVPSQPSPSSPGGQNPCKKRDSDGDDSPKSIVTSGENYRHHAPVQSEAEAFALMREAFPRPNGARGLPEHQEDAPAFVRTALRRAEELGLVARWARWPGGKGFISIHDPTTGEWHDVQTKDAPGWAKWEAGKRKELYKAGDRHAYDLTRSEMEEIWETEHLAGVVEEGIVEEYPVED